MVQHFDSIAALQQAFSPFFFYDFTRNGIRYSTSTPPQYSNRWDTVQHLDSTAVLQQVFLPFLLQF